MEPLSNSWYNNGYHSKIWEDVIMIDLQQTLLIVCPLVFLGGLIDAVAGGGGLITLPAYLLA